MRINDVVSNYSSNVETSKTTNEQNKINEFESILKNLEGKDDKELEEVFQEFESIFINMIMKNGRAVVDSSEDSLFSKSQGQQMFEEMLDEELSKNMSTSGGIGLAKMLVEQYKRYNNANEQSNPTFDVKK
jgi:flagellar protein FlgJ